MVSLLCKVLCTRVSLWRTCCKWRWGADFFDPVANTTHPHPCQPVCRSSVLGATAKQELWWAWEWLNWASERSSLPRTQPSQAEMPWEGCKMLSPGSSPASSAFLSSGAAWAGCGVSVFNNPLPLTSPISLKPASWEVSCRLEGKRTGKRGFFCSHFGLLDATPFCQKECRSPCCKTPMAFPQQVLQPPQATSLSNRLRSFSLAGAKSHIGICSLLHLFWGHSSGKTSKHTKNITWTGTWRKPGGSAGLCGPRAW